MESDFHFAGQPIGKLVDEVADTSLGKIVSELMAKSQRLRRA